MRATIAALLIATAATLAAAPGDVPLSPVLKAPLPSISEIAIASSGTEYLLVYSRGRSIYWQRIKVDGTPIDQEARLLAGAVLGQGYEPMKVVWTGERYLVFWNQANVVVAQGIDREGVVTPRFNVVSGFTFWDAARREHEVAVLSSGAGWRFTVMNSYGTLLGSWSVAQAGVAPQIVRLDEGWTLVDRFGLTVVNPQSGASRAVAPGTAFETVIASPNGGALAFTADGSIGVLRRDGSLARSSLGSSFERLSLYRAAYATANDSGWTIFYRAGGAMRIASVSAQGLITSDRLLSGSFPRLDGRYYYGLRGASARHDNHLLLQPAEIGTVLGLESIAVAGTTGYPTGAYAITDALQQWGRVAHGPGMELVAWLEAGRQGWDLRATRVKGGVPLDEGGILLWSGFPSSVAVAYDGNAFAVVWSDREGVFVRRIDLLGAVIEAAPMLVSTAPAVQVSAAGSGDGGLLISWLDRGEGRPTQPVVAYLRAGRIRSTAPVGSDETGHQMETGGSRQAYLVVFADRPAPCQIGVCEIDLDPVSVQLVSPAGVPTGGPVPITDPMSAVAGKPVWHEGEWFVPFLQIAERDRPFVPLVVRLTGSGTTLIDSVRTIEGDLRSVAGGLEIVGETFRGMLSSAPENLWFEPLPLGAGDAAEGVLAANSMVLVNRGTRFVLRPLASGLPSADIALVYAGRSGSGTDITTRVRIEHRGGDDVPALSVDVRAAAVLLDVTSSRPIVDGRIAGVFKAGETIELTIRGDGEPFVTVLPFAREIAAADNFLLVEGDAPPPPPPPPPSPRRRLVVRP